MTCNASGTLEKTIPAKGELEEQIVAENGSKTELALMKFWEKTGKCESDEFRYLYEQARS